MVTREPWELGLLAFTTLYLLSSGGGVPFLSSGPGSFLILGVKLDQCSQRDP